MIDDTLEIIATAFGHGRMHDFRLYKESRTRLHPKTPERVDSGYQGLQHLHEKTILPIKGSKKHPLSKEDKQFNHDHASVRIFVEHTIRRVKVFRIIKETYRNRGRRFALRFNLIAAIVNLELKNRRNG